MDRTNQSGEELEKKSEDEKAPGSSQVSPARVESKDMPPCASEIPPTYVWVARSAHVYHRSPKTVRRAVEDLPLRYVQCGLQALNFYSA